MPKARSCAVAPVILLLLGASGALAQQPGQLDHVAACRLDPETVRLSFTFEGGACQQPGEAALEDAGGGLGTVIVPTEETAEICTMQLVQVEFSEQIAAGPDYTTFDIAVLNPEGEVQALGSAGIVDEGPGCEPPEAAEAAEAE